MVAGLNFTTLLFHVNTVKREYVIFGLTLLYWWLNKHGSTIGINLDLNFVCIIKFMPRQDDVPSILPIPCPFLSIEAGTLQVVGVFIMGKVHLVCYAITILLFSLFAL